jgi:hypothetical protein
LHIEHHHEQDDTPHANRRANVEIMTSTLSFLESIFKQTLPIGDR